MWGWFFLFAGAVFFLLYWSGTRKIGRLLFIAYLVRIVAAITHKYIFILPAGCCDAVKFEEVAWEWSAAGLSTLYFDPSSSYVISWIGSMLYGIFGRDPLLLQMVNVFIGTMTVLIVYKTARLLCKEKTSLIIAWLFALHPTVIEHSVVFLREAPVVLGLALSIYFFTKWFLFYRPIYIILCLASIIFSSLFHGAMILSLLVILFAVAAIAYKSLLKLVFKPYLKKGIFSIVIMLFVGTSIVASMGLPTLSTVGNLEILLDAYQAAESAGSAAEARSEGGAVYLQNLTASNPVDILWQAPIRSLYFVYAPFPWNIRSITHLKGFIDSGFLIYFTFLMWTYRRELWANKIYRYLLLILLLYIAAFSFGTANFGSAIRHKAKFLPIIVLFYGLKDSGVKYVLAMPYQSES
ncbi:MAG: glycosyltransferase family 39 protein [Balneolaceae bacterium]